MMKLVFVSVFSYLLVNYSVRAEDDGKCTAPNGEIGTCLIIHACPMIYNAINKVRTINEKKFLNNFVCGWIKDVPKVCCNVNDSYVTSTNTTVITRFNKRTLLPNRSKCGFQDIDKILGGTSTLLTEFPWTALLVYTERNNKTPFKCGGALINEKYVLTAAHCGKDSLSHVRLGEWNLKHPVDCIGNGRAASCSEYVEVEVETFKSHENFHFDTITGYFNDIARIRLKEPVHYTVFIQPICLPKTEKRNLGDKLWVTGWGITNRASTKNSDIKQKVQMQIISLSDCLSIFRSNNFNVQVNDSHICAMGEENESSCTGDSGNPFMATLKENESQFYAEGIVSYSDPHCTTKVPVVFTRVSHFMDWIENNIEP